jgi:hypothetical protein
MADSSRQVVALEFGLGTADSQRARPGAGGWGNSHFGAPDPFGVHPSGLIITHNADALRLGRLFGKPALNPVGGMALT